MKSRAIIISAAMAAAMPLPSGLVTSASAQDLDRDQLKTQQQLKDKDQLQTKDQLHKELKDKDMLKEQ